MKFTVLGAGGEIGKAMVAYLHARDFNPDTPARNDYSFLGKDLGYVFYCIGLTADFAMRPFDTVEAHSCLIKNILQQCEFDGLVYLSSTRLYDSSPKDVIDEKTDLTLNPHNPRHIYDLSKALGESICLRSHTGKARIARLSSVYTRDLESDNFMHQVIKNALHDPEAVMDSAPHFTRDYVFLDDVCNALFHIATKGKEDIYNVAAGSNLDNATLFAMVNQTFGSNLQLAKPADPSYQAPPVIQTKLLQEESGLMPTPFEKALAIIKEQHKN